MRKTSNTYYFSVEGETEKWYLEWLKSIIDVAPDALHKVKFVCHVQKDPVKLAKRLAVLDKMEITHIIDRESEDDNHTIQFETALDRMNKAEGLGRGIKYRLGYSNFTFELWIILHKDECNGSLNHRRQYLSLLNRAYGERFENLDQYKHEDFFKRILGKLTLDDVRKAVQRSKAIMVTNQANGYVQHQYKGFRYYTENPSTSLWEIVEKILRECGLM